MPETFSGKLSVVVPARDEEGCVESTIRDLVGTLRSHGINFEIVVVDDGSQDQTLDIIRRLNAEIPEVRMVQNQLHGFGRAVACGLRAANGDAVAVVMADASDSPDDLIRCYRKLQEGFECVFGSRFIKGSKIIDYPAHKLLLNRLANLFIKILFRVPFNDFTNAFKLYRKHVVEGIEPLISPHFNLTVEMPLKAIVRGYSFGVIPINWMNRKTGGSKLKIKEMGSRYLFIVLYIWLEKHLSRGDYRRSIKRVPAASNSAERPAYSAKS